MCNRICGLKEWSEIPRTLARSLINFEYNPNVAPTEQVPAFPAARAAQCPTSPAERGKPLAPRMARFGINLAPRRQEAAAAAQCAHRHAAAPLVQDHARQPPLRRSGGRLL